MRILVTGAAGHLGGKLVRHLTVAGHQVTGLDLMARSEPDIVHQADLSCLDDTLRGHFAEQEVVVHLAADRSPAARWETVIPHNIDAVLNLFEAARFAGVPRVVFASSNWVLGGHRFGRGPLGAATEPAPINPYGMSKLMGERIGAHFAAVHGMTVVCTRIGWTQWTHDNRPGPHMAMGTWGQEMWLSDRDYLDGMTAAATAPVQGFAVVNLMSDNPGMRWSLDEARQMLGYSPADGALARRTPRVRLADAFSRLTRHTLPALLGRIAGRDG
jgi:NAD+ dependent glucose-6-phosphate dehydrogenase